MFKLLLIVALAVTVEAGYGYGYGHRSYDYGKREVSPLAVAPAAHIIHKRSLELLGAAALGGGIALKLANGGFLPIGSRRGRRSAEGDAAVHIINKRSLHTAAFAGKLALLGGFALGYGVAGGTFPKIKREAEPGYGYRSYGDESRHGGYSYGYRSFDYGKREVASLAVAPAAHIIQKRSLELLGAAALGGGIALKLANGGFLPIGVRRGRRSAEGDAAVHMINKRSLHTAAFAGKLALLGGFALGYGVAGGTFPKIKREAEPGYGYRSSGDESWHGGYSYGYRSYDHSY